MKRADDLPPDRARSKPTCSTASRLARAAWPRGKTTVARRSAGVDRRPARRRRHSTGGQKHLPAGRRLVPRPGLRADQAHASSSPCKTDVANDHRVPPGAAERSEPAAAAARAARSRAPCALTEFEVEAAPADEPDKTQTVKFVKATADVNPPETPLDADLRRQERQAAASPGPIDFAIDGKDETAWGIDAGPGRRNQPRKAVFVAEKPIANPGRHDADVQPRRRTTAAGTATTTRTTTSAASASRSPTRPNADGRSAARRACARSWPSRASERTPAQDAAVFSYWRTTVAEWKDANDRIEALWQRASRGRVAAGAAARATSRATRTCSSAATSSSRRKRSTPGVPAFLHPLPADAPPTRLTFARWLVDRSSPTTARAHRQSRLAGVLRHRPGRAPARTSARRASRRRIPSCSTGWPSSSWSDGWSLKNAAPADRHVGDVPAVVAA